MSTGFSGPLIESPGINGRHYLANFPLTTDPDYVVEKMDFLNPTEYNTTDWTATVVDADTDGAHTIAVETGVVNGELKITNNDADDDSVCIQKKVEAYKLVSGKRLWLETSLEVSHATDADLLFGLVITDTTPFAHTDGVTFRVTDGSASISCRTTKNSTTTTTASGVSIVAATKVKLGIYYNGSNAVEFYVDRNKVATHTANICDDEELAITIGLQNGSAAARTASIDYILVAKER